MPQHNRVGVFLLFWIGFVVGMIVAATHGLFVKWMGGEPLLAIAILSVFMACWVYYTITQAER